MKLIHVLTTAITMAGMALPGAAFAKESMISCGIGLDREILPAGKPQRAVIRITLDAPMPEPETSRPPVNLGIVLDRSGSMSGSKIQKAREAAVEALRRLDRRDIFSLVIYDHEVDTLVPAQQATLTEWVEGRINGIQPRGNTALFGGVSQGAAEIRKHLGQLYIHRAILLSDGIANVGPSSPADLARLGTAMLKEGISVTTIGVGTDFNEDLMTQLAQASDGNHYFVETSTDLPRIFARELGDVLSVVARQVLVEVECPAGVRPIRIIGRDGHIKGNRAELYMNQLYGGQEKYALIEVELPAGADGAVIDVATARCTYENALNQRKEESSGQVQARFSGRIEEVQQSADVAIQQAILVNEMAVTRDEALDLYNAGDFEQAGKLLRSKQMELMERNTTLGLDDLAQQATVLDQDASEFELQRIDNVEKKEIRAGSYQIRSQQQDYTSEP